MIGSSDSATEPSVQLLALYGAHVTRVFSYLWRRCSNRSIAEELTSETFLSALDGLRRNPPQSADMARLAGIARHKLVDHWRRLGREERNLKVAADSSPGSRRPGPTSSMPARPRPCSPACRPTTDWR